jgi:hypothetical protein
MLTFGQYPKRGMCQHKQSAGTNAGIKRMPCHVNQRQALLHILLPNIYEVQEVVQVEDRLRLKTQLSGVTRVEPANIAGLRFTG